MVITHQQAITAVNIITGLIEQAFPDNSEYVPTQMNIHPSSVKEMYDLVKNIKENKMTDKQPGEIDGNKF